MSTGQIIKLTATADGQTFENIHGLVVGASCVGSPTHANIAVTNGDGSDLLGGGTWDATGNFLTRDLMGGTAAYGTVTFTEIDTATNVSLYVMP